MKINYPLLKIKIKCFFNLATEEEKAALEEAFIRSQKERMEYIQRNLSQHQIHISDDTIDANTRQMPDGSYLVGNDSPKSRSSFVNFGTNGGKLLTFFNLAKVVAFIVGFFVIIIPIL